MAEVHVAPTIASTAAPGSAPWPSTGRAWYSVVVFGLTVFTLFGTLFVVSLIVEPIRLDLNLTDLQVALIFGSASPFILAIASLLVGPLADIHSRRLIIGLGLVILGLSNLGTALVTGAAALLFVRLLGGIGGAGNGPATFSLLADTFPPAKLPKAMAAMNVGFMLALGLAYILGGHLVRSLATPEYTLPLLGTMRSWQVVFVILSVPDLVLGMLVLFTVLEASRRGPLAVRTSKPTMKAALDYRQVLGYLSENRRAFAPMYIGLLLNCIATGGNTIFMPAFYQRTHGWGPGDFGVYQGWVLLILAPTALLFGGWLAERMNKRGMSDANQRVVVWASLAHIPFATLFALVPSPWVALALASLNTCVIAIGTGPQNAAFQAIAPNNMRAKITATFLFMFTIGQALGPIFIGFLTTYVFGDPDDLRYALALMHGVLGPLAAWVFWTGLRAYGKAYERARALHT